MGKCFSLCEIITKFGKSRPEVSYNYTCYKNCENLLVKHPKWNELNFRMNACNFPNNGFRYGCVPGTSSIFSEQVSLV